LADDLPSFSSLQSLDYDTRGYEVAQHDSSHLALFSALSSSSLRFLIIRQCSFRATTLDACWKKVFESQLTYLQLANPFVFAEGSDPSILSYNNYEKLDLEDPDQRSMLFPQVNGRFCFVACTVNVNVCTSSRKPVKARGSPAFVISG
jgi:hypothetical protein